MSAPSIIDSSTLALEFQNNDSCLEPSATISSETKERPTSLMHGNYYTSGGVESLPPAGNISPPRRTPIRESGTTTSGRSNVQAQLHARASLTDGRPSPTIPRFSISRISSRSSDPLPAFQPRASHNNNRDGSSAQRPSSSRLSESSAYAPVYYDDDVALDEGDAPDVTSTTPDAATRRESIVSFAANGFDSPLSASASRISAAGGVSNGYDDALASALPDTRGYHWGIIPPNRRPTRPSRSAAARVGWAVDQYLCCLCVRYRALDPRSPTMSYWDLVMTAFILFTAVVTPFEVAFIRQTPFTDPLFIFNRIVDSVFAVDVCINFNTMYFDERVARWVTSRRQIAWRYLSGMASIDVISTIPFDTLVMLGQSGGGGSGGTTTNLEAIRTLRILRLIKLLRILRASRVLRRLEDAFYVHYLHVSLMKLFTITCLLTHWMACMFHLVRSSSDNESTCNWVNRYFNTNGPEIQTSVCKVTETSLYEVYSVALYWATMTVSTVGYGDVVPTTDAERLFVIGGLFVGATFFSYVVGTFCNVVEKLGERTNVHQELMSDLNAFIVDSRLDQALATRLRTYFRHMQHAGEPSWQNVIDAMSPALRGAVALQMNAQWVTQTGVFRGCPQDLLIRLSFTFQIVTYPPLELFFRMGTKPRAMHVIRKGLAIIAPAGAELSFAGPGAAIGDESLWTQRYCCYTACTMTFTEAQMAEAAKVRALMNEFQEYASEHVAPYSLRRMARQALAFFVAGVTRVQRLALQEALRGGSKRQWPTLTELFEAAQARAPSPAGPLFAAPAAPSHAKPSAALGATPCSRLRTLPLPGRSTKDGSLVSFVPSIVPRFSVAGDAAAAAAAAARPPSTPISPPGASRVSQLGHARQMRSPLGTHRQLQGPRRSGLRMSLPDELRGGSTMDDWPSFSSETLALIVSKAVPVRWERILAATYAIQYAFRQWRSQRSLNRLRAEAAAAGLSLVAMIKQRLGAAPQRVKPLSDRELLEAALSRQAASEAATAERIGRLEVLLERVLHALAPAASPLQQDTFWDAGNESAGPSPTRRASGDDADTPAKAA